MKAACELLGDSQVGPVIAQPMCQAAKLSSVEQHWLTNAAAYVGEVGLRNAALRV
jgi:hypothetical protein